MEIKFCKVRDVKTPNKGHAEDAGIDFFIPNDFKEHVLHPSEDILIPSGIKAIIPNGWCMIAFNKSGVATKMKLRNGAVLVDAGYRGEIHIHLFNDGLNDVTLKPGMKIMQFCVVQVPEVSLKEITTDDFDKYTSSRGANGFGSSGMF